MILETGDLADDGEVHIQDESGDEPWGETYPWIEIALDRRIIGGSTRNTARNRRKQIEYIKEQRALLIEALAGTEEEREKLKWRSYAELVAMKNGSQPELPL